MVFVLGPQPRVDLLVLVAFSWPGMTTGALDGALGRAAEVEAARALGASSGTLPRDIFPHTAPFVFTQLIFFVLAAILAEAGLAFLGWAIRRCPRGARDWRTASGRALSSWATGGGSSRRASRSSSRRSRSCSSRWRWSPWSTRGCGGNLRARPTTRVLLWRRSCRSRGPPPRRCSRWRTWSWSTRPPGGRARVLLMASPSPSGRRGSAGGHRGVGVGQVVARERDHAGAAPQRAHRGRPGTARRA